MVWFLHGHFWIAFILIEFNGSKHSRRRRARSFFFIGLSVDSHFAHVLGWAHSKRLFTLDHGMEYWRQLLASFFFFIPTGDGQVFSS